MVRRLAYLLALLAILSCASVPQFQREAHAQRSMGAEPCVGTGALASHVLAVREGGMAPATGSGSGCGCD